MIFLCIPFFSFLYAIKGGFLASLFKFDISSKLLSSTLCAVFMYFMTGDGLFSVLFTTGWILSVAPSVGEEHGAIGRSDKAWGPYIENKDFGRSYGIKKALQRGAWIGAMMALFTGYVYFIAFSVFFVPCVFIGQEFSYRVMKREGWLYSEFLVGLFLFGVPTTLFLMQ